MTVVADASPLLVLAQTDLLYLLPMTLGEVLVPPAVWEEITVRPEIAAKFSTNETPWLHVQQVRETEEVRLLLEQLHSGEAEAIVLANEMRAAAVLIDERRGRMVAKSRGLEVIGTLGFLLQAKENGVLLQVKPIVLRMRDEFGFRVSDRLISLIDDRTMD